MDYKSLAEKVVTIAQKAGEAILEVYTNDADFAVELKTDESPLTKADKAANEIIVAALQEITPDIPIVSEENKEIPYEERQHFTKSWLVDPLDGTKEFIKRNGEFTVNIALIENQMPVLGVVYAPYLNEMYWAVKGEGAYKVVDQQHIKLDAATYRATDSQLHIVCSRSHMNETTQAFVEQFERPELVAKGSSLKFLIIAKGEAHIYPRLAPTMEWDTGAAQIVLEEAGGKVVDNETKAPLKYNKENLRNPHFIAYAREVSS